MASEVHAQRSLIFLVFLAIALVVALFYPFWVPLTLAAVFAAALHAWLEGLTRLLRGRRRLAALLLTLGVLLAVVVPLGGLGAVLVQNVRSGIQWVRDALAGGEGLGGLLPRLPGPAQEAARRLVAAIPDPEQLLRDLAGAGGGEAAQAVGGLLLATGSAVLRTGLFLVALFFLLADGPLLVSWLDARVPLRPGQLRTLVEEFRRTSSSVVRATAVTAALQTAVALVGYLVAGAPNLPFLALATFLFALAVGGTVVVILTGLLLLGTGHVLAGLFLLAWAVVVSLTDNVARPYLLRDGVAVHGGLLFFGLVGGLAVFGGIGIVLGPLALTFLVTALNLYRREFGAHGEPGEPRQAPAAPPPSPPPSPPAPATTS